MNAVKMIRSALSRGLSLLGVRGRPWRRESDGHPVADSSEELADAIQALRAQPRRVPGHTHVLGWDLDYVDGSALASSLDLLVLKGWNDFLSDSDEPVILDCGANIGISILNYKRQFPKAHITAFEPDPDFLPILRRNLSRNGISDVRIINGAVSSHAGHAQFFCEGADGSRLRSRQGVISRAITVRTVSLTDYITAKIDLIKMDIEGAEFDVLPSLAGNLDNVRRMVIECHVDNSEIEQLGLLLQILGEAGFVVAVDSYGPWRDLVRQPPKLPHEFDQYILVAAWRQGG